MQGYGLIGRPLGHSYSALFFGEKFAREGLDCRYELYPLASIGELPGLLDAHPELRGLNVTIPYKEAVLPYLDALSDEARDIGAVNVVKITRASDGRRRLVGHNSDAYGFRESLRPALRPGHRRALVLGTGGAAKAVTHTLAQLGIEPTEVSRHEAPGRLTYAQLTPQVMHDHTLVVNATPVGMAPDADRCPDIPYGELTPAHLCYDLVYNPSPTLFLRRAAQQGAATVGGLDMLHLQALRAWQIWTEP